MYTLKIPCTEIMTKENLTLLRVIFFVIGLSCLEYMYVGSNILSKVHRILFGATHTIHIDH